MRVPSIVAFCASLIAIAPGLSGQSVPAEASSALQALKSELPYLKALKAELTPEAAGLYVARNIPEFAGLTVVVFHPQWSSDSKRMDVALLLPNLSLGALWSGFDDAYLDVLGLEHPVVIYAGAKEYTVETVKIADLPAIVGDAAKFSADELYLRKGPNLTSKIAAKQGLAEALDILKSIGLDLNDLVVQCTLQKGRSVLLRKKGDWNNPFLLKNSKLTDPTFYFFTQKLTKARAVAGWGQATIGSTSAFLYAERVYGNGKPMGDAYALNGETITLQAITDLVEAIPANPFPTTGLSLLPLDKIQLKNPNYVPPPAGGGIPEDLSKFIVSVATTPAVLTPDGRNHGPYLYANGDGTIFGFKAAHLLLKADLSQIVMSADVTSPKFSGVNLGDSAAFALKNTSSVHEMSFAGKLDGKVGGYTIVKQDATIHVSDQQLKFSVDYGASLAGARANFVTGKNYAMPWTMSVDVTGAAGQIFDLGLDAYNQFKKALPDGVTVVEPEDVTWAMKHADNLAKEQTWTDLGKDMGSAFTSTDPWESAIRKIKVGQAFKSPDETIAAATKLGKSLLSEATGLASDAEGGAKKFFNKIGDGFKKIGHLFSHGGHKHKPAPPPPDPATIVWNGYRRPNIAYHKPVTASSEETKSITLGRFTITQGNKELAVDGMSNPPDNTAETYFVSQEEPFPWIELDLGQSYKVEAIIIETPENLAPQGLKGAIIATDSYYSGRTLMHPEHKPRFQIQEAASIVVIQPSIGRARYRTAREEADQAAKEYYDLMLEDIMHTTFTSKPSAEEKEAAHKKFLNAYVKLAQSMSDVRYIRIYVPAKARLAITEIRVVALPEINEPWLFVD